MTNDNWLMDWPSPSIPHAVRRKRFWNRVAVVMVLLCVAAALGWFEAPSLGEAVTVMAEGLK